MITVVIIVGIIVSIVGCIAGSLWGHLVPTWCVVTGIFFVAGMLIFVIHTYRNASEDEWGHD